MAEETDYVTVQEAAEFLGVSRRRVWDMTREGRLRAIVNPLDRREKLIDRKDLQAFAKFIRPKQDVSEKHLAAVGADLDDGRSSVEAL